VARDRQQLGRHGKERLQGIGSSEGILLFRRCGAVLEVFLQPVSAVTNELLLHSVWNERKDGWESGFAFGGCQSLARPVQPHQGRMGAGVLG
jgi:hypothetical protein